MLSPEVLGKTPASRSIEPLEDTNELLEPTPKPTFEPRAASELKSVPALLPERPFEVESDPLPSSLPSAVRCAISVHEFSDEVEKNSLPLENEFDLVSKRRRILPIAVGIALGPICSSSSMDALRAAISNATTLETDTLLSTTGANVASSTSCVFCVVSTVPSNLLPPGMKNPFS